jgi:hypothetical protein
MIPARLSAARSSLTLAAVLFLLNSQAFPGRLWAQEPTPDVETLRAELEALRQEYQGKLAALEARLAQLETSGKGAVPPPPPTAAADAELLAAAQAAAAAAVEAAPPAPAPMTVVSGAGGKNFLNLSLDGLLAAGSSSTSDEGALQLGGHDPTQRGFTVQNVETVFEGAVDPFFRGQANVVMLVDAAGETVVELEEAYLTSTSFPAGLQLKAGQFLTEFGRLNPSHPHGWDFVDQPLVNGRMFGPDGLRSVGARLSWLLPTNFYSEAMVSVQNGHGETLSSFGSVPGETLFGHDIQARDVSTFSDLLIVPRYTASFDLSDTQTLLVGASAAFGPNGTGPEGRTRIYGVDGFWKWKPTNAFRGFPFLKLQGELMRRDVEADASTGGLLPRESFADWGGYVQASWGFKPGYVAGLRLDRVGGDQAATPDPELAGRWRISPAFTWFPTEFSKLRLQYNFDRSNDFRGDEQSLWVQVEFLLGAHAAHKF